MTTAPATSIERPGIDFMALIGGMLRFWPLLIILPLIGAALGFEAKKLFKPTYTSSVAILLDPKRPGSYGAEGQFANLYVDAAKVNSVVAIIQSAGLLSRVVQDEKLADDPAFIDPPAPALRGWLDFIPYFRRAPELDTREARELRALARLSESVSAARDGITYVIKVQASARDPATARRLADAVASAYLNDQVETKFEAARRDRAWLTDRLNELRARLISSEQEVEAIRRQYGLVETNQGPNATTDRQNLADLNAQLNRAEDEVSARKAKFELVERIRRTHGDTGAIPEVGASMTIRSLRLSLVETSRKLAELSARYTVNYSERESAERDRRTLESQIKEETTRIMESIRNDYESSVAHRNQLKVLLAGLVEKTSDTNGEGRVRLREAQRIVDANRAFYDGQLARLREIEQQESRRDVEARIISPATTPGGAKFPRTSMFVAGGLCFGLFTGLGVSFLGAWRSNKTTTASWIEETLSLPILALVPLLTASRLGRNHRQ